MLTLLAVGSGATRDGLLPRPMAGVQKAPGARGPMPNASVQQSTPAEHERADGL